jgi:hypothetical protein
MVYESGAEMEQVAMARLFGVSTAVAVVISFTLAGCASTGPAAPRVAVMPSKGKSYEKFQREDAYCQNAAQNAIGGRSPGAAANEAALGGAVLGTGLGAATGALIGAAAGNRPGTGAAIGAGSGLLLGTAVGSGSAREAGGSIQSRYDVVYTQCMAAKGNDVGGGPGYPGAAPYY